MPTYDDRRPAAGSSDSWVASAARMATAGMSTESMGKMASEVQAMVAWARSGGFMVSEDAGRPIRDTLAEMQTRVEEVLRDFSRMAALQPPLGAHDYGRMVAAHQQEVAVGERGSALSVLKQLSQVLSDADKALEIAMEKYKESETSASDPFKSGQS